MDLRSALLKFVFIITIVTTLLFPVASAQILPNPAQGEEQKFNCNTYIKEHKDAFMSREGFEAGLRSGDDQNRDTFLRKVLGCAIASGRTRLFMLPFFLVYIIEFLLQIAGLIAVLFVVIGGYRYVLGGITEDKESGKKTITHALVGLVLSLSAWIIVNFIQVALTS